ncbi:MAG: type II secretion system GspH family protein [Lentisphaeria bacterium]|nr:type II secretion system GspH family protein [Lentisphaeria bacterium]
MNKNRFTLIELLTVAALIALLSGVVIMNFTDSEDFARNNLQTYEIHQVVKAFKAFKKDTGYYPKTGPFAYSSVSCNVNETLFDEENNLYQLFKRPKDIDDNGTDEDLWKWKWNPEYKVGWKGPYLNLMRSHVVVSENENTYISLVEENELISLDTDYYTLKGTFGNNFEYYPNEPDGPTILYYSLDENKNIIISEYILSE